MRERIVFLACRAGLLALAACGSACTPTGGPKTGTQTNWLETCRGDSDCGGLRCLCGVCTQSCDDDPSCSELPGASCVAAEDAGAMALCSGSVAPTPALCLARCPAEGCASGRSCVAGVCVPSREPTTIVSVDEAQRFQTLVGFGAGVSYVLDEVAQHPRKAELFDAMFSGTGLSVLRLRNRHGDDGGGGLGSTSEIVAAAAERLGRPPMIILNSGSPPGALKANGSLYSLSITSPATCSWMRLPVYRVATSFT